MGPYRREIKSITRGIFHCADTPNGYGRYTIADIDAWHKDKPHLIRPRSGVPPEQSGPWSYCAYNYVIHVDGIVMPGRGLEEIPSATSGVNFDSVAVCLVGKDKFTQLQWEQAVWLCDRIEARVGHTLLWSGHRDHASRECPGFDVYAWYERGRVPTPDQICEERPYGR